MPTYQYVCTDCGERLEVQQSFSDDALTMCPDCDGRLRKVFGAVGVVFKGSGFYRTDSRAAASTSKQDDASDSKPAAKESGNGTDATKAESKPAAKTPAASTAGKGSAA